MPVRPAAQLAQLGSTPRTPQRAAPPHLPPVPSLAMGPSATRWPREVSSRPRLRVRAVWSPSCCLSAFSCTGQAGQGAGGQRVGRGGEAISAASRRRKGWYQSERVFFFF